jgi:hypothetical protein
MLNIMHITTKVDIEIAMPATTPEILTLLTSSLQLFKASVEGEGYA